MTQEHMTNPANRQELIAHFQDALVQAGEKPEVMAYMLHPGNLTKLSDEKLAELTRKYQEHGATAQSIEGKIKALDKAVVEAEDSILGDVKQHTLGVLSEILKARKKDKRDTNS